MVDIPCPQNIHTICIDCCYNNNNNNNLFPSRLTTITRNVMWVEFKDEQ